MAVPNFLMPLINVTTPPAPSAIAPGGPSGPVGGSGAPQTSGSLANFSVPHQQQDNWCWAAVTLGVLTFFNRAAGLAQCDIAKKSLGRLDCCPPRTNNPCDCEWTLDTTLRAYNALVSQSGPCSFADVVSEITTRNRPLCCRIGWNPRGGHFVALGGWTVAASGVQYVDVSDPLYVSAQQPFRVFSSSYQNAGRWTDSYFTQ
jgi:hypothetical protein